MLSATVVAAVVLILVEEDEARDPPRAGEAPVALALDFCRLSGQRSERVFFRLEVSLGLLSKKKVVHREGRADAGRIRVCVS